MQTFTIDILNEKAIKLLKELEHLKLIRVRKKASNSGSLSNWAEKYYGTMSKEPISNVDAQLKELRDAWQ
jgi:hypothetical protein